MFQRRNYVTQISELASVSSKIDGHGVAMPKQIKATPPNERYESIGVVSVWTGWRARCSLICTEAVLEDGQRCRTDSLRGIRSLWKSSRYDHDHDPPTRTRRFECKRKLHLENETSHAVRLCHDELFDTSLVHSLTLSDELLCISWFLMCDLAVGFLSLSCDI